MKAAWRYAGIMVSPPVLPMLENLAAWPFCFDPPIVNIEHNEWVYRKQTWSEILVANCRTAEEIWIPRRFIGEIPPGGGIVALTRELEYRGGAVWPSRQCVLQMPAAAARPAESTVPRSSPAPVVGIRLDGPPGRRPFRLIGIAVLAALGLYALAVNFNRAGEPRHRNSPPAATGP
jgi:hypothetical protein